MDLVDIARFLLSFVVVIGLIVGFAWLLRRYGAGRIVTAAGKGRLGVIEVAVVDPKRRLVLVRRDDREHLLLLSPTNEMVVETGIAAAGDERFADRLAAAASGGTSAAQQ